MRRYAVLSRFAVSITPLRTLISPFPLRQTLDLVRDCAAVGIQRCSRYVTLTPGDSAGEREPPVLALRFLAHFVGDLHQPLHVGFAEDLVGN
jgi:S1/P1 Nuclease